MATERISKVYVTDRSLYDNIPNSSKTNNVYFVREGTSETSKLLSLYFGSKKQCDILDVSDIIDFSQANYGLPTSYQVEDKLLFAQQVFPSSDNQYDIIYRAFMWNGTNFIDCFGEPNNVIICENLPSNPVKDFVYIDLSTGYLYVYNGQFYINIISDEQYATIDYVNEIQDTLMNIIDNLSGGYIAGITEFDYTKMRLPDYRTGTVISSLGSIDDVAGITILNN